MGFRQAVGGALRLVGVGIVLFLGLVAALLVAVGMGFLAQLLGLPHLAARGVAWAVLLALEAAQLLLWRRARRRARERRLAAARELRQSDPSRYWSLLGERQGLLPEENRDAFVGRKLLGEQAARERAKRADWVASTPEEAASVERLTRELENATLVRSIEGGGGAEVVGTIDWVGYRYRVEADGTATLLESDASKVRRGRAMSIAFFAGIVAFLVGAIAAVTLDHTVGHAGWGLGLGLTGGVVGFIGQTGLVGPRHFADSNQHWTTVGSGWREID